MKFKHLFTPVQIRGMHLRNRVVFPAMGTKMGTEDRYVTQQLIDYHAARAQGGNGLNMVEVCSVHQASSPKNFLAISEDKYIPKLRELVDAIHAGGASAGLQLWQGGLAVGSDQQALLVIPDPMPVAETEYIVPAATPELLQEVAASFGMAARRAAEAGFDCVEYHCGHNYSPHSFLSAAFNHRTDEYGGSLANRARYPLACIRAIRENIPENMPIFMRIDAHDDYLDNGLTIEEVIEFCKMAGEAGVDVLDVSRGNFSSAAIKYEVPPVDLPQGFNVDNAARIRKETGMLTIAVGRINNPELAEEILTSEKADMVVIGRGQLADPEFCNKAREGREEEIVRCVGCNQGCYDGFVDPSMPFITCLRNPALGREQEYKPVATTKPKKVLIAGGGMAGLEAAITLKERGHFPVVVEAADRLGGQFLLAGTAPHKEEMTAAAEWMGDKARRDGVEIRLNTSVTPALIDDLQPDEVIIAIGASPIRMNIPGIELPHVTDSHTVLAGKADIRGRVVVIGGGLVGLEVAEYLSEREHVITVLEMQDEVAKDLGALRKISVMERLAADGVNLRTNAKCTAISTNSVTIEVEGTTEEIPTDSVVVAVGAKSRPWEQLKEKCIEAGIPCHIIGDAVRARRALNATAEAAEIARII